MNKEYFEFIGSSVPSPETPEKARGTFKFPGDYYFEDMIYLKLLTSKTGDIDIKGIDFSDLLRMEGVVDIFKIPELPYVMICATDERVLNSVAAITEHQISACKNKISFEPKTQKAPQECLIDGSIPGSTISAENRYVTSTVFYPHPEPEGGVAFIEDRVLTVIFSGNNPYKAKQEIARSLKIPLDSVKTVCPSSRATFSGAIPVHLYLATAAYKTAKPVKLILDYGQGKDIGFSVPMDISVKTEISSNGSVCGHNVAVNVDTGISEKAGDEAVDRIKSCFAGIYNTAYCNLELTVSNSSNCYCGNFPGEGHIQSVLALESQLDILSKQTGKDPLDLRIGLLGAGSPEQQYLKKILLAMKDSDLYKNASLYKRSTAPSVKRGIGVAACMLPVISSRNDNNRQESSTAAKIYINEQRRYQLELSHPDSGNGAAAVFAQIAAEIIGCGLDKIKIVIGTSSLPDCGATGKGGTISIAGEYVRKAAEDLKTKLMANGITHDAFKRPSSIPGKLLNITGTALSQPPAEVFSGAGHVVLLEVNTDYCTILLKKAENFVFAGNIINPQAMEGAVYGAVARTLGYVTGSRNEFHGKDLPPEMINHYIDGQQGGKDEKAFGARSVSRILGVALAPAILNAFFDAVSIRPFELPLSSQRLYGMLYGE